MIYVPYLAILAAFVLIHVPRIIVGQEMKKQEGGYNNSDPRAQQMRLEGLGRRALAAHNNGFEAFGPFAVAVLACGQRGVKLEVVAAIAIGFVVVRSLYVAFYLADKPSARSGVWTLGMLATLALFVYAVIG